MRCKLWQDPCPEYKEAEWLFAKSNFVVWLAETDAGEPMAFLEAQTCNRADGCDSDCILYIEGWYVEPEFQHQGIGSKLMQTAEDYARACGWKEIASDALIDNHISHEAHKKLGFVEVDRQISYMKKLREI